MNKVYGVVFKGNNKPFCCISELDELNFEDEVIVDIEDVLSFGKIVSIKENDATDISNKIVRKATSKDKKVYEENLKTSLEALNNCKSFANELNLDMYPISSVLSFDKSQLLITFTADNRIDFRDLAKKLASIYHTRIELRQIGARDKSKMVGGIGICGQKLCCSNFLKEIESISMNKAKNQNLALNPNKINGACGRLLCCLCYEDDEYTRCSKDLLAVGSKVKYKNEDAIITGVDILSRTYKLLVNEEKISVPAEEIKHARKK